MNKEKKLLMMLKKTVEFHPQFQNLLEENLLLQKILHVVLTLAVIAEGRVLVDSTGDKKIDTEI